MHFFFPFIFPNRRCLRAKFIYFNFTRMSGCFRFIISSWCGSHKIRVSAEVQSLQVDAPFCWYGGISCCRYFDDPAVSHPVQELNRCDPLSFSGLSFSWLIPYLVGFQLAAECIELPVLYVMLKSFETDACGIPHVIWIIFVFRYSNDSSHCTSFLGIRVFW